MDFVNKIFLLFILYPKYSGKSETDSQKIYSVLLDFILDYFFLFFHIAIDNGDSLRTVDFSAGLAVAGTVVLNLLIRTLLVLAYRHPPFVSIVLHPISILYTARIAFHAWNSYRKDSITWKGRAVIKEENTR
jgi:hypothetical protein